VAGSLSETRTAVSSAKVAMVVGEVEGPLYILDIRTVLLGPLGEHRHELGIGDVGQR
jgi:hypothetical protein